MAMYRQGDILIVKHNSESSWPTDPVPRVNGRIILAEGEATGHAVADAEADLVSDSQGSFLRVWGDSVDLVHEEHAAVNSDRALVPQGRLT